MIVYSNNASSYSQEVVSSGTCTLDNSIYYTYDVYTLEVTTGNIKVYQNSQENSLTVRPRVQYNGVERYVSKIYVGSTLVFNYEKNYSGFQITGYYMYYYNGSWKSSSTKDSIASVKSYVGYSGSNIQYGVYVKLFSPGNPAPELYIENIKATIYYNSAYNIYVYNNYVVAIFNYGSSTLTSINPSSSPPSTAWGTIALVGLSTRSVNVPPYTMAFFNIASAFGLNVGSSTIPGSSSGSGSGSGSGTYSLLRAATGSNGEITGTGSIKAFICDYNTITLALNYLSISLNFLGINSNYHAAM